MKNLIIPIFCVLSLVSCKEESHKKVIAVTYPKTQKVDTVDIYFGNQVYDPYRWLEDDMSEETESWVKAQNEVTFGYLDSIQIGRASCRERV